MKAKELINHEDLKRIEGVYCFVKISEVCSESQNRIG